MNSAGDGDGGDRDYDLVVVGGGMGGLATAALARRLGLRTALLEAHVRLGGCAGHFRRGPFAFDVGATALMGFGAGEPIGDLLGVLGIEFPTEPTSSYRVHLPDRRFEIVADRARFLAASIAAFPPEPNQGPSVAAQRRFWWLQEAVGRATWFTTSASSARADCSPPRPPS